MIRDLTAENPNELRLMDVESALGMVDHSALMRDGIHFNTQSGIQRINNAFQTRREEMDAELRTMINPAARGSAAGRVRSQVPQPLANRLGPLARKANMMQPAPSSDMRERLGTSSVLGESTWDKMWSTTSGSSRNYEHSSPTRKDAADSKES